MRCRCAWHVAEQRVQVLGHRGVREDGIRERREGFRQNSEYAAGKSHYLGCGQKLEIKCCARSIVRCGPQTAAMRLDPRTAVCREPQSLQFISSVAARLEASRQSFRT